MVLSTEWSQVEVIDLVNDGSGLGFGIVGGKSTGVVIKSILPGGIADKDSRLQSGDHILQIGEVNLRGLAADQVASVLRQTGPQVRMVVARPIEPSSNEFQNFACGAPIVPTKLLTDPEELDRTLLQNGYLSTFCPSYEEDFVENCEEILSSTKSSCESLSPETERFKVVLQKNEFGLGITIAGYVCERENLTGIFVKSLTEGSEAFNCGKINVNDRIVEVDGQILLEISNFEAVEKLKQTGTVVELTLERFLRGPKYDQLQEAFADQLKKDLSPASITTLSWIPIETGETSQDLNLETLSVQSEVFETKEIFIEENFKANPADDLESAIKLKWESLIEGHSQIVVANLTKLKGLGISLEGTVDVEQGIELRPHHYIRSILPEGPVGVNGKLSSGDELLEVNGQKLLGIKHVEVVKILKELPHAVRLVCARKLDENNRVINTSQDLEAFEARNIVGGSLKNLLPQQERLLLKALSDTSLNTSSTVTVSDEKSLQKAKSLDEVPSAMWSNQTEYIELVKGDRGLGFSILDYQDPLDPTSTVIVVRSLVPNGSAEKDGRLEPGDRLISVNEKNIKNATLDQAVQALKTALPGLVKLGIAKPLTTTQDSS